MNRPDELERLLGQQLHQQVDGMTDAPIGLGDVKGRAGRIRRNRRIAGGVAVAAVLAVAVPTALLVTPGSQRADEVPPATGPTSTVLALDGLEVGAGPTIEYFDEQGVVLPVQGVVPLDEHYQALIENPGADGWLAVSPSKDELVDLTADFERTAARNISQSVVTTPDQGKVAFVYSETGAMTLIVRDTNNFDAGQTWDLPVGFAQPIGFLDDGSVLYFDMISREKTVYGIAQPDGSTRPLEADIVRPVATDPTTGRATVMTKANDDGTACYGVLDVTGGDRDPIWETCDYQLGLFSPDGRYVMASDPYQSGNGKPSLHLLEADTGALVASFVQESRGDQTPIDLVQLAWEDDDSVLAVATEAGDYAVVRLSVDGSIEQAVARTEGTSDVPVYLGMDRALPW